MERSKGMRAMTPTPNRMAGALPDIERVREARASLAEAGVRYVFSCWIDLFGMPKTKPVPLSDFENLCMGKGPQFAVHSISFVPELTPADSDQIPVPISTTVVICPWDRNCAWMFADLWWEDAPYNLCSRQALKRVVADAADKGFAGFAGIEPSSSSCAGATAGPSRRSTTTRPLARGCARGARRSATTSNSSIDSMGFLGALIDILDELGWGLKDVVAEGRIFAVRARFRLFGCPAHADRMVFLRVLLKEVAKKHAVRHLHAQAHRRRLAFGRAYQLLDAARRCSGREPLRGPRRRLGRRRLQRRRRPAAARRGAHFHRPARRSIPITGWCPGSAASRAAP